LPIAQRTRYSAPRRPDLDLRHRATLDGLHTTGHRPEHVTTPTAQRRDADRQHTAVRTHQPENGRATRQRATDRSSPHHPGIIIEQILQRQTDDIPGHGAEHVQPPGDRYDPRETINHDHREPTIAHQPILDDARQLVNRHRQAAAGTRPTPQHATPTNRYTPDRPHS